MSSVAERAKIHLGFEGFKTNNKAEPVVHLTLTPPHHPQNTLRCPIKTPNQPLTLPVELAWCAPLVAAALTHHKDVIKAKQHFVYLTVRHGLVWTVTDDEWHVDGFSMRFAHIPEQNYVWTSVHPTEQLVASLDVPKDFNPLVHNIHHLFKDFADGETETLKPNVLYVMDPYVIHRRPPTISGMWRTFVRLSLTPIPIADKNNTPNPELKIPNFRYDGVENFRNQLIAYT